MAVTLEYRFESGKRFAEEVPSFDAARDAAKSATRKFRTLVKVDVHGLHDSGKYANYFGWYTWTRKGGWETKRLNLHD